MIIMVQWNSTRFERIHSRKENLNDRSGTTAIPDADDYAHRNDKGALIHIDLTLESTDKEEKTREETLVDNRSRELVLLPPDKLPEHSSTQDSHRFLKPNEYESGRRRHYQFVNATARYMRIKDWFTFINMLVFLGAIIHWIVRTHVAAFMAPRDPSYYSGFFWTEGGVFTTFVLFIVQALGILATKREFILLFLSAVGSLLGYSLYYMSLVVLGGRFADLELLHILLVCTMCAEIRFALIMLNEMKKPEVKKLIASWDQEEYYDPSTPEGFDKLLRAYLLA